MQFLHKRDDNQRQRWAYLYYGLCQGPYYCKLKADWRRLASLQGQQREEALVACVEDGWPRDLLYSVFRVTYRQIRRLYERLGIEWTAKPMQYPGKR